jgi:hypothetical protein
MANINKGKQKGKKNKLPDARDNKGKAMEDSIEKSPSKIGKIKLSESMIFVTGLVISIIFVVCGIGILFLCSGERTGNGTKAVQDTPKAFVIEKIEITLGSQTVDLNNGTKINEVDGNSKNDRMNAAVQSFDEKIKLANIFFKYMLALILALGGIIGVFSIIAWSARERREEKEKRENVEIRKWELQKLAIKSYNSKKDLAAMEKLLNFFEGVELILTCSLPVLGIEKSHSNIYGGMRIKSILIHLCAFPLLRCYFYPRSRLYS